MLFQRDPDARDREARELIAWVAALPSRSTDLRPRLTVEILARIHPEVCVQVGVSDLDARVDDRDLEVRVSDVLLPRQGSSRA